MSGRARSTTATAATDEPVDRSPSRFGTRVALAAAVVVVLALGVSVGTLFETAGGVVGVLAALRGVRALGERGTDRRAAASLWLTLGTTVALVSLGAAQYTTVPGATVTAVGAFAVAATGLAGLPRPDREREAAVLIRESAAAVGVLAVLALIAHADLVGRTVGLAVASGSVVVTHSALAALVALQVIGLALVLSLPLAQEVLDEWLVAAPPVGRQFGVGPRDVPVAYWVALAVQAVAAWRAPWLLAWPLDQLSVLGDAVRVVLTSGVLHASAAVLFALVAALVGARVVQHVVVSVAGDDPPATAAAVAGPLALAVVGTAVLWVALALLPERFTPTSTAAVAGSPSGLLAVVAGALALALVVTYAVGFFAEVAAEVWRGRADAGPLVAGVLVLVAAVAASQGGASALVVFGAVAGALVVWDAGEYAARLGRQVGRCESRRAELAHVTGSLLVGAVAVVVTTLAALAYLAMPSPGEGRASVALALALVALLALLTYSETETGDDAGGTDGETGAD